MRALVLFLLFSLMGIGPSVAWEKGPFRSGMTFAEAVAAWGLPKAELLERPSGDHPDIRTLTQRDQKDRIWLSFCHDVLFEIQMPSDGGFHEFTQMVEAERRRSGEPDLAVGSRDLHSLVRARWVSGVAYWEIVLAGMIGQELGIGRTFGDALAGLRCR